MINKYTDFDSYWRANRFSLMEIYSQSLDPWLSLLKISENIWRASHLTAIESTIPLCQAACGSTPPADPAPTPTITEEEQSYINWLTQRKTGAAV